MLIQDPSKIEEFYQALLARNSQYLGIFFVAVKTTQIFCISTCRARKPKLENVLFYTSSDEALQNGFRPCKICRPIGIKGGPPPSITTLVKQLTSCPELKISDKDLKEMGYSPEWVRRKFKQEFGMTFHAYQRMIRMNKAFDHIKEGVKVTDSAFTSGYGSLSGFGYSFKTIFNTAPQQLSGRTVLYLHKFSTPIGPMIAAATHDGLGMLEFADRKTNKLVIEKLCKKKQATPIFSTNEHLLQTEEQVHQFFQGSRFQFELKLDVSGTDFQKSIWDIVQKTPYGTTTTYQQIANSLERSNAPRAIGRANADNRIAIVIPCHRVLGSNGQLKGYGGGIARKQWLLDHEFKYTQENKVLEQSQNRALPKQIKNGMFIGS